MTPGPLRTAVLAGVATAILLVLLCLACNAWVVLSTRRLVYASPQRLPPNPVGLVLGTSPHLRSGAPNPYFRSRVQAAVALYRSGLVSHLLVSGANPSRYYNEPRALFEALVARGVPARAITLDFAGLRTLDSVVRARRIFGQRRLTIISQRFHDYRALFIAEHSGLHAVAFAAPDVQGAVTPWVRSREFLARVRAVLDLFALGARPRFLGRPQPIRPAARAAPGRD